MPWALTSLRKHHHPHFHCWDCRGTTQYLHAIPGEELEVDTGLVEISRESIPSVRPLSFVIADRVFTMDVAAQLIPTDKNNAWGGVTGKY
ncbi:hypothetical protein JVT61DRAFT_434 [Boletus reticuloceps]|uniref:Uncharacterized protein n=1 Tax=Boletus reticuloceps TaxID=495285 RepID=A0A8I2Z128_9AGAM|nr:hypothetical protein JVT61DRAFT_434 [Boletus reticuloceps]